MIKWNDGTHKLKSTLDKLRNLTEARDDREAQLYEAEIELMVYNRRKIKKLKRLMYVRSILDNGYLT